MTALLGLLIAVAGGCAEGGVAVDGPRLAVDIAALSLSGVGDVVWDVEVRNGASTPEVLWQRRLTSSGYGDGAGSASYVGTCDASSGVDSNTVRVWVVGVFSGAVSAAGTFASGAPNGVSGDAVDFQNPTAGGPLEQTVVCRENADVAVRFDVALLRPAQQGFFDVAVNFSSLFCSAKLDCEGPEGAPLELLFDADGARARTVVVGLACTGDVATGARTYLYHDAVELACAGGRSAIVDASAGPGNLSEGAGITSTGASPLFGAAVYRGHEQLGFNKLYWNVLLGVEPTAASCQLTTSATASPDPFVGLATPAGATWPYITWDVAITDGGGLTACGTHPVNGTGEHAGVATQYADITTPETFDYAFSSSPLASAALCVGGALAGSYGCAWTASGEHAFVVPAGVTTLHAKLWGAAGGTTTTSPERHEGGAGGFVGGDFAVTPGETITVEISPVQTSTYGSTAFGGLGGPRAAVWRVSATDELLVAGGGGGSGSWCV
ncbi:MAG: hypothetical protein EP329_10490, partial [Deltaproteobacteria bacterium]